MGVLAHILRQFYLFGQEVKRSSDWLIERLIEVGDGKSMWLQLSPWLGTSELCWDDECDRKKIDQGVGGELRSERGYKRAFSSTRPGFCLRQAAWDTQRDLVEVREKASLPLKGPETIEMARLKHSSELLDQQGGAVMIFTAHRILVLAILLVLAVSSMTYGTEVPRSFLGTYQGSSRACQASTIVLRKENISWDECKSKKAPYTVVEADEEHVLLEVASSDCDLPFIKLGGTKLNDGGAVQTGLRVSGYKTRGEALSGKYGLNCVYDRVDPAIGEDQTGSFLSSKSATERQKALEVINQQGHPECQKYNEMGLNDPYPGVRATAAMFLRGDPYHCVPLLIKAMAHDPDPRVRANAAESLTTFRGADDDASHSDSDGDNAPDDDNAPEKDNAAGEDPHVKLLENNLDQLLIGLQRLSTLGSVVKILGVDEYEESVVCHMSAENQEKALNALRKQIEAIQTIGEVSKALHPDESSWITWQEAGQRISHGIEKISKCYKTTQSARAHRPDSTREHLKDEQQKPVSAVRRQNTCEFTGLALPESYAIFAAGAYSGRTLDFQIDKSGHQATQMDVTVNYSSKPVVLILAAYEPTIWNIKWTASTRIAAVFVSGYHRQAVAGLDATVPVLNSSYDNRGPCGHFYVEERGNNLVKLNETSRKLFGHPVDLVYFAKNGEVVVGDAVPTGGKLLTSESNPPESFHERKAPIAGPAGLEDAARKGLLRRATAADFNAWVDAVEAHVPNRDLPSIAGQGRPKPLRPINFNPYVVLKPFTYPEGLYGGNSATLFIPEGVPQPKGNPGHAFVYDFNKLKAYKKALEQIEDDRQGLEDQRKEACTFPGLELPKSYAIFAAGNYSGRNTHFQIDQSGHQATQMNVTVNYTSKPVVLMLGAYEPTIWNIKWTASTRIAAVFVSGYHRQAVAGLDAAVPVLNSSHDNKGPCGRLYVGQRESELSKLNPMARRLFGRSVDLVYLAKNGKVVVGDPVPAGEKRITSASNPPESFYDKTVPRAGRSGLKDAVRQGLLRKATDADIDAWVNAEIANAPKKDAPPTAGQGRVMPRRPSIDNAYVVLKPFTFPAGLYGNPATFFIPKGVPRLKGNSGHSRVYDFNKFKIEPPKPAPQTQESKRILAGNIHAASFDCSKATSEVEKLICIDAELCKLDETLMMKYLRVLDRTGKKEEMIQSQNQWLENERNECQDAQCIKKAYELRIKELGLSSYGIVIFRPPIRSTPYSEVNNNLLKAAKKGSLEDVKTLLEKSADLNAKDQNGLTVLMYAALSGNLELVKHLVNRGADVNARDTDGFAALMFSSRLGNVDVMTLLIDHGADVNFRAKDGKTALMAAAAKGHLEAVRFLLERGADVNVEAANGYTARQFADEEDNEEIVRLLESHGAEE